MLNIMISFIIIISTAFPCIAETNFYIKHIDTFIVNGSTEPINYKNEDTQETITFIDNEPKQQNNEQIKQEKGESKMDLGTWIMIVLVMVVVAKVAHKITMKTFFKPVKTSVKAVKKEWEEA